MKKAAWIFGMAGAGFFLGLKGEDGDTVPWGALIGAAWLGGIGYGLGTIFDTKRANRPIKAAWTITLALVGIFVGMIIGLVFHSNLPEWQLDVAGAAGACCGALLGYLVGHRQRRRILSVPPS
jgi:peptidoglycan/LPS O-acetylase OafA/YrhL